MAETFFENVDNISSHFMSFVVSDSIDSENPVTTPAD